jgi:hypothetical protein
LLAVYSLESGTLRFFLGVDSSAANLVELRLRVGRQVGSSRDEAIIALYSWGPFVGPKDTGPKKSQKVALENILAPEVRPLVKRKSNVPAPKPIPSETESTLVAADRLKLLS